VKVLSSYGARSEHLLGVSGMYRGSVSRWLGGEGLGMAAGHVGRIGRRGEGSKRAQGTQGRDGVRVDGGAGLDRTSSYHDILMYMI